MHINLVVDMYSTVIQRDKERADHLPEDEAMAIAKESYKEDILNGFDLLHIDPTKDPDEYCKVVDIDVVFNRTIELIEYCEQVRKEYGVLSISELVLNYLNRRQLN